jgi:HlyD family secretion protein
MPLEKKINRLIRYKMKKILRYFLIAALVAGVLFTFFYLWKKSRPKQEVYELHVPKQGDIELKTIATGKVEPRDEVAIVPQISGIVSQLYKEPGEMAKAGEIIAHIQVIPEMGVLNAAESRVTQAGLNLNQVQRVFDRTQELYKAGVVVPEEYENTETQLKLAREELRNAQDHLEIVRDGIVSRSSAASNTQIRSTISGMILDIPIKVGNSVIQANTFNAGTTIATVADMNDMLFHGNIDETEVGRIKEGMLLDITIGALQDQHFDAVLEYISPKSTESNGAILFEIKAAVTIPKSVFVRAGYSANAEIILDSRYNVLVIPESSVEFRNGDTFVKVYEKMDGDKQVFSDRQVITGLSDGIYIEIKEGLTIEDKVRGTLITQ